MTTRLSLAQIQALPIEGNAFGDCDLLEQINLFVLDIETSKEDKKAALRVLDDVMGLPHPTDEDNALNVYIKEFSSN